MINEKKYSKLILPSLKDAKKRNFKEVSFIQYKNDFQEKNNNLYHIKTYGCQGNLADSEKISGILEEIGYASTNDIEKASIIVFNTCAIRENAENRVFGELGRIKNLKKLNPELLMILCGCMSQEEVVINLINQKYPQVDIVLGTHNIHRLKALINEAKKTNLRVVEVYSEEGDIVEGVPVKRDSSSKAWINIMYGCDEFCTYCIVPYTRGRERSRRKEDIISEVKKLVEEDYKEITLIGQNVNAYGKDFTEQKYTFANLLKDLAKTGIKRIRFTTSHPKDLDLETIKVMKEEKVIMPHLHLPVQSGSDHILKKMNRKYTKNEYLEKIKLLREYVEDISITTDIIVGFPGEDETDFNQTLDLVEKASFEGAYTFIFSKRSGTPAYNFADTTTEDIKKERLLKLNELINLGYKEGNQRFVGTIQEVLVDKCSDKDQNFLTGYTRHNKVVNFIGEQSLIGKIVNVKIEKAFTWHLLGKLI